MIQNLRETKATSSNLTPSGSNGCGDSSPAGSQTEASGTPSVVAMCATDLEAMQRADDRFQAELVRVYGRSKAGDARYKRFHQDDAVQAASDAFVNASKKWHATLLQARAQSQHTRRPDLELLLGLHGRLRAMGFGTDESINGADLVDQIGELFIETELQLQAAGVLPDEDQTAP